MTRKRVQAVDFKAGKPVRWQAYDTFAFDVGDASKRKMTSEGFMVVPAFISRTGIQDYTARELGLEGTNRTIRLNRPPEEVFKPASYGTFERQTLTNNHPEGEVTAANYRQVTSGDVHDVAPAGDGVHLGANLYVKAGDTVEMVVTYDKTQISCGYSFVLDMTPGVTPGGEAFDGVMRDIVGNHVAIVWQARGGPGLRVADKRTKGTTMRVVTIDGVAVNFEDDNQGAIVEAAVKRAGEAIKAATDARDEAVTAATKRATDAETALAAQGEAMKKLAGDHQVALDAALAQVLKPEQVQAMVAEIATVIGDARKVSADFVTDGKTAAQVRCGILDAFLAKDGPAKKTVITILGGLEPAKAADNLVRAAFDTVVATAADAGTGPEYERRVKDALTSGGGAAPAGARVIQYPGTAKPAA